MGTIRVIVADTSGADLYDLPARRAALQKVGSIANEGAARHERDLGSGPPGRVLNRIAGARHTLQPRESQKQHATARFARTLARAAGVNARSPGVDGLVLVASPRFLSAVKSHLPKSTLSRVIGEVRLNLVEAPRSELQQHVRRCLPPPPIR
ncbi:MAG: host attachment protein [Gammaproteobacteria bacterium]|nr:host attachment protein [Gammaproteobacteria bacterium]